MEKVLVTEQHGVLSPGEYPLVGNCGDTVQVRFDGHVIRVPAEKVSFKRRAA